MLCKHSLLNRLHPSPPVDIHTGAILLRTASMCRQKSRCTYATSRFAAVSKIICRWHAMLSPQFASMHDEQALQRLSAMGSVMSILAPTSRSCSVWCGHAPANLPRWLFSEGHVLPCC
jgi:hypothetical protein